MRPSLYFLFTVSEAQHVFKLVAKALSLHSENEMDFSVLAAKYVTHSAG